MKLQLIRNATMKITYAGHTFLTDPMLSEQGAIRSFAGKAKNPTVPLPFSAEEVVRGSEMVLVTHVHPDHFDPPAAEIIPKDIPFYCQPEDTKVFKDYGFQQVIPVETQVLWEGITITRTGGMHGKGEILEKMGVISGFVLQAEGEPTVYWVGDSIWCQEVEQTIKRVQPEVIITHSGGAVIPGFEPIIMDMIQTKEVLKAAPEARVIAVHMEALDHCTVSRAELRLAANEANISLSRLLIPADGEIVD